ncbi:MAG: rod shape-determining protein MreD [Acidimicrobiales bacterium]
MTLRLVLRTLLVVALALLVQNTLVLEVRVDGISPDIMYLLPIAAGLVGGPAEGAVVGFVAGLAADLLLPTPFGLTALVGTLVGFGIGAASGNAARHARGLPSLVALVSSGIAVMLYAVLGALIGESQFLHVDLPVIAAVVGIANCLLAGPAVWVVRWALGSPAERPVEGVPR